MAAGSAGRPMCVLCIDLLTTFTCYLYIAVTCIASLSPPWGGGSKNVKRRICVKIGLCLKKVCYKVYLCENCQRQSCKAFIGLTNRAKMIGGGGETTPSTGNIESKWPRWSEVWPISCDNSKRYEIGCQLLLITNRKLHTGFRLVPTSVTLNDLENRNSLYFVFFFTDFDRFSGRLYHCGWR